MEEQWIEEWKDGWTDRQAKGQMEEQKTILLISIFEFARQTRTK